MAKKNPIIPFSMTPASWGLKGDSRKIAEAEYNLEGEDLDRKLAEIKYAENPAGLKRALIGIDLKHNRITKYAFDHALLELEGKGVDARALLNLELSHLKITEYEYDVGLARLDNRGKELKLALLGVELKHEKIEQYDHDIAVANLTYAEGHALDRAILDIDHAHSRIDDFDYELKRAELDHATGLLDDKKHELAVLEVKLKNGKIDEHQYEKETATINEAPWVRVIDSGFDPEQGVQGVYFEFDWNEYMILYLRMNGYSGPSEASIIDSWFTDLCKAQGLAATNGNPFEVVPFAGPR